MSWQPIKIGNGGTTFRPSIADDGTMLLSTDTGGGYIWDATADQWVQLITSDRMPTGTTAFGTQAGVYELVIDPSNSNNIWMNYGGTLYKSTNKGVTFTATTVSFSGEGASNNRSKIVQPKIAVDPANSNVVYAATASQGLYVTTDGSTFNPVATVSAGLPMAIPNTPGPPSAGTNSTDAITIGTGTKNFNHLSFSISNINAWQGGTLQVWQTSNPANQMFGTVLSNGITTLSLNVTTTQGSGSGITDWTIANVNAWGSGHCIAFDKSGGTQGSGATLRTKNVYIHTYCVGTWKSIDGGATFNPVAATGRPNAIRTMKCDLQGTLWVADDDFDGTNGNAKKYNGTAWTSFIPSSAAWYDSLAIDYLNSGTTAHVAYGSGGAQFDVTSTAGSSWSLIGGPSNRSLTTPANDVTWYQTFFSTNPTTAFFGSGGAVFDPINSGRLYVAAEGFFYCSPFAGGANLALTQQTRGVEEFIGNKIISPVADVALIGVWDFSGFRWTGSTSYPTTLAMLPNNATTSTVIGYAFDWQWNNPNNVAAIIQSPSQGVSAQNYSCTSTDGGVNWTLITGRFSNGSGDEIAIADTGVWVWVQSESQGVPQETTNSGASWAPISIPGGTPSVNWGESQSSTLAKTVDSDKANGDIYLYNQNAGNAGPDQIYKRTKATGAWSLQMSPNFPAGGGVLNGVMKSVGVAGHLFFSGGLSGPPHPNATPWYFTTDGWATVKSTVVGFKEVQCFGYGAVFPGKSYPTLFAVGWYNGGSGTSYQYGIWMCSDFNTATGVGTWSLLGVPINTLFQFTDIDGDKTTPGKLYTMTNAGGFAFLPAGSVPTFAPAFGMASSEW